MGVDLNLTNIKGWFSFFFQDLATLLLEKILQSINFGTSGGKSTTIKPCQWWILKFCSLMTQWWRMRKPVELGGCMYQWMNKSTSFLTFLFIPIVQFWEVCWVDPLIKPTDFSMMQLPTDCSKVKKSGSREKVFYFCQFVRCEELSVFQTWRCQ